MTKPKTKRKFSPFYTNNLRKSFDHTMNRLYDLIEAETYLDNQTEFVAEILTGKATGGSTGGGFFDKITASLFSKKTKAYKIRFHEKDEDHNYLASPFRPGITDAEKVNLISLHPWAFLEDENMGQPEPGAVVLVKKISVGVYVIEEILGHTSRTGGGRRRRGRPGRNLSKYKGYRRGLPEEKSNGRGRRKPGKSYDEPEKDTSGVVVSSIDKKQPTVGQPRNQKGLSTCPDWETLKLLGKTQEMRSILDLISYFEGGYNTINVCGGNLTSVRDEVVREVYGKSLMEMSIITISDKLHKIAAFDCGGKTRSHKGTAFAVGAYQIIPETFAGLMDKIPNINTYELYDIESQDAFGVGLIFTKQERKIAKYLFGGSITRNAAQLKLAREWAAFGVPIDLTRSSDGKAIKRGQSYYCGRGGNRKCTPPSANELNLVQRIAKILEDTRNLIKNSTDPTIKYVKENYF